MKYVLENRLLDDPLVKTRTVIVLDVDECTYDGPHEQVGGSRGVGVGIGMVWYGLE